MDILFHILFIVIIAVLYFIYKFSNSQNPMIFVILITLFAFVITWQDSTYITTGYNTSITYGAAGIETVTTFPIKEDWGYNWALYLTYLALFLLAVINLTTGEEYNTNKKK